MALVGLSRRSKLCKICNALEDDKLSELTLDVILQRRSWTQIKDYYNAFLPPSVSPITDVNLNNHKKHSNPELIAEDVLKQRGEWKSESDIVSKLYAEIFKDGLDKVKILQEIYRERLSNLKVLQSLLNERRKEYQSLLQLANPSTPEILARKDAYNQIRLLVKDIDAIQEGLQDILLKEKSIDKGISHGNIHITQNYVNVFQGHLKGFLEEVIPYFLLSVFKDNQVLGKEVVKFISDAMDKHLAPALEESKLLSASTQKPSQEVFHNS